MTKFLPGVDELKFILDVLHDLDVSPLWLFHVWCDTTGVLQCQLEELLEGHWHTLGSVPLTSTGRFVLTRAAQSSSFHPTTDSEQNSAGKKEPRPRLPPYSLSTIFPLHYHSKRYEVSDNKGRNLMLLIWDRNFLSYRKNMESFDIEGERTKVFFRHFSLVLLQILPLWAKPSKASCRNTAPALAIPVGRVKPSHLGCTPTQETWLIFGQRVICWPDSHKQQTPLINMRPECLCCSSVLHPIAPTLPLFIWRISQK